MGRKREERRYGSPNGCVYFVLSPILKRVKIGFSRRNPSARIASFSAGCPEPLVPLGIIMGGPDLEKDLHRRFGDHRRHGEWFEYCAEIEAYISERAGPWPDPKRCFLWNNVVPLREAGPDRGDGRAEGQVVGYDYLPSARTLAGLHLPSDDPAERDRTFIEDQLVNGRKPARRRDDSDDSTPCRDCHGTGSTPLDGQCPDCGGSGRSDDRDR